jgi:hypothetical protein
LLNYHRSLRKTASFYIKYAILWKTKNEPSLVCTYE